MSDISALIENRFFKAAPAVYEALRAQLDTEFGHPNGKAATCLPPEPDALHDGDGDVVVGVLKHMTEWPEVAPLLAEALGDSVTEITDEEYRAAQAAAESAPTE